MWRARVQLRVVTRSNFSTQSGQARGHCRRLRYGICCEALSRVQFTITPGVLSTGCRRRRAPVERAWGGQHGRGFARPLRLGTHVVAGDGRTRPALQGARTRFGRVRALGSAGRELQPRLACPARGCLVRSSRHHHLRRGRAFVRRRARSVAASIPGQRDPPAGTGGSRWPGTRSRDRASSRSAPLRGGTVRAAVDGLGDSPAHDTERARVARRRAPSLAPLELVARIGAPSHEPCATSFAGVGKRGHFATARWTFRPCRRSRSSGEKTTASSRSSRAKRCARRSRIVRSNASAALDTFCIWSNLTCSPRRCSDTWRRRPSRLHGFDDPSERYRLIRMAIQDSP